MTSASGQGNTPPAHFNHVDLARVVREHAYRTSMIEKKTELPLSFTASAAGMDRQSFDAWIDCNIHSGLGCTPVLTFANWTNISLKQVNAAFDVLKRKMHNSPLLNDLEKEMKTTSQYSNGASLAGQSMSAKVRTFLVDIMNRSGIRPIDEEIASSPVSS